MANRTFRGSLVVGTSEVQTLTIGGTPDGGTFKLRFRGQTTGNITWSATNNTLRDNVDTALEALAIIPTGGVTVAVGTMTAGIGTLTITFSGTEAKKAQPLIAVAVNALTGSSPTVAVAETTPGVDTTRRDASPGDVLTNLDTGATYLNTAVAAPPTWTALPIAQAAFVANVSGTTGDTDPEARAAIEDLRDAMVTAGIMAAS